MFSRKRKAIDDDSAEYYNLDINQPFDYGLQSSLLNTNTLPMSLHPHSTTGSATSFMPTPMTSPCSSHGSPLEREMAGTENHKKQTCKPVETHIHRTTLDRLYQAQINLARCKANSSALYCRPNSIETQTCEDCDKPIPEDEVEDYQCVNCAKVVCESCSIRSIYRNNLSLCLHCS
ncbi:hypothetical protein NADFUDRAFT_53372 [Nadsonia fulvescens var. elongata DSM 6958]|uniref:UBP-type domain-containing protein n=1 Tax=Nadsonia fulvescens var. elongata DSM 6958 TaxID=857566 RepID=A0A1E3PFR4_9ASCO|nr:hypothetical protein NADFUDRAFT_53372 [Nadsonia fulvescens var. elongata DSM 6958]